ncbi:MAG: hypothetical protein Aurels2KO_10600 [Aureliella sp.]
MGIWQIDTDERCEACRQRTGEHLVASERQLGTEQRGRFGMRMIVCSQCLPKVVELDGPQSVKVSSGGT